MGIERNPSIRHSGSCAARPGIHSYRWSDNEHVLVMGPGWRDAAHYLAGMTTELNALHRQRDALTDADAHRRQSALAADFFELMRRCHRDARTRHAKRMAERDRAAIRVDVLG